MKNLNELNKYRIKDLGFPCDNQNGIFIIPNNDKFFQVVATSSEGWEHVSMCIYTDDETLLNRCPKYDEMLKLKQLFFNDNEVVMEIHPCNKEYIDNHPYVLHLWKPIDKLIPLPNLMSNNLNTKNISLQIPEKNKIKVIKQNYENCIMIKVFATNKKGNIVDKYPTWEERNYAKNVLIGEDESAIELHLPNSNRSKKCVDIYKYLNTEIELPPSYMVGLSELNGKYKKIMKK